jgi:hypothetical protein
MSETVDLLALVREGREPVRIERPAELGGKDLNDLLVAKGILHRTAGSGAVKEPIGDFLKMKDSPVTVEAFYFTDRGPFLMMFDIETKAKDRAGKEVGVVARLTGDDDLGQLFEVTDASARVLCCTKGAFEELRRYTA